MNEESFHSIDVKEVKGGEELDKYMKMFTITSFRVYGQHVNNGACSTLYYRFGYYLFYKKTSASLQCIWINLKLSGWTIRYDFVDRGGVSSQSMYG